MTERTVVVGDTHGNLGKLRAALTLAGAIGPDGSKAAGVRLIHVGDLTNCVNRMADSRGDYDTLLYARKVFDTVLVGNHELMAIYGVQEGNFTNRADPFPETKELFSAMTAQGHFLPATSANGWLVTHAGVHPYHAHAVLGDLGDDVEACAERINEMFVEQRLFRRNPLDVFCSYGPVRSQKPSSPPGGVFWADYSELRGATGRTPFPQMFGHTPQAAWDAPAAREGLACVDISKGAPALIRQGIAVSQGPGWEPIVFEAMGATGLPEERPATSPATPERELG